MAFGNSLRSAAAPDSDCRGIGGDSNTIWCCDNSSDTIYELSTADFSEVRNAAAPNQNPIGIGGDANTIWMSEDFVTDDIYELSTVDLSSVRNANAPGTQPYGTGGDANTIWHTDNNTQLVYELSTVDFSVIRGAAAPVPPNETGIGGDAATIWFCGGVTDVVYELSTLDLSIVRQAAAPNTDAWGIGGDSTTIWHSDRNNALVYELDAEILPAPWLPGWDHRIRVRVRYADCIGAAVTWFPVSIIIEGGLAGSDNKDVSCIFDELTADANRKKIAVTKADGTTELYVEIEQWADATEDAVLHVSRTGWIINADTYIFIYFDITHADNNAFVGDITARTEVWDGNFEFVCHMVNDNGNVDDSTSNSVDGTKKGAGEPAEVAGRMYKGQHFDGADDFIALADDSFAALNVGTIECWIKRDLDNRDDEIFSSSDEDARDLLWLRVDDYTGRKLGIMFYHVDGAGVTDMIYGNTTLGTGWRHVAATSDGAAWIVYVDGAADGINIIGNNSGLWFNDLTGAVHAVKWGRMAYSLGTTYMDGIIDEARISSVARSAAWILGTYHSGLDDLLTYGDEELLGEGGSGGLAQAALALLG